MYISLACILNQHAGAWFFAHATVELQSSTDTIALAILTSRPLCVRGENSAYPVANRTRHARLGFISPTGLQPTCLVSVSLRFVRTSRTPACQTRVCPLVQFNTVQTAPAGVVRHEARDVARAPQSG